jgi:hypothetical protein
MNTPDLEIKKLPKFYGLGLADYWEEFIYNFGGIRMQKLSLDNITQLCSKNDINKIFVDEDIFLKKNEYLLNLIKNKIITQLIVLNAHPFKFSDNFLKKINEENSLNDNLIFLTEGFYNSKYTNLKIFNMSLREHFHSHHFNLQLSTILKKRRKIYKDFLLQVVPKDEFRTQLINFFLINIEVFDNSVINVGNSTKNLNDNADNFIENIIKKYGDGQHISALKSFGNGLPNFSSYEKIHCEIVVETRNTGSWHLTEKTFRPISLGTPIVFLGYSEMFKKLEQDGYRLYDYNFYRYWHSNLSLQERLPYLLQFLKHIKYDKKAKEKMLEISLYNQQHFWNNRKIQFYETLHSFFSSISQDCNIIEKIYEDLNF